MVIINKDIRGNELKENDICWFWNEEAKPKYPDLGYYGKDENFKDGEIANRYIKKGCSRTYDFCEKIIISMEEKRS